LNKNKTDIKKIILAIVCIFKIALTNAQLQTFQWAKSIGEVNNERVKGIALDASGNVYTIGFFQNTVDFDPGPGTFNLTAHAFPFEDIFILKLDAAGNFVWAKNIGGAALGNYSIAVDASENVYTAETFSGKFSGAIIYNKYL
jgi:hypothetical protein